MLRVNNWHGKMNSWRRRGEDREKQREARRRMDEEENGTEKGIEGFHLNRRRAGNCEGRLWGERGGG